MDEEILRTELRQCHQIELGERIGEGGFGKVHRARTCTGVPCAIKVSLRPIRDSGGWGETERKALEDVKNLTGHPHICTLFDIWEIRGHLVTRWELGETSLARLLQHCRQQGIRGIPRADLLRYMYEAADALDFLNRTKGVYHRDVKPDNLLLFFGHVKLGDLGLAKFVGASSGSHTGSGTMGYVPPEAWDKHRLNSTCDLYSLAATYIRLRTGNDPFGDPENVKEVILRQLAVRPALDGLEPAEVELLCHALALEPKDRPQDGACAWVAALAERAGNLGERAQPFRRQADAAARLAVASVQGKGGVRQIPAGVVTPPRQNAPPPKKAWYQREIKASRALAEAIYGTVFCPFVLALAFYTDPNIWMFGFDLVFGAVCGIASIGWWCTWVSLRRRNVATNKRKERKKKRMAESAAHAAVGNEPPPKEPPGGMHDEDDGKAG